LLKPFKFYIYILLDLFERGIEINERKDIEIKTSKERFGQGPN